MGVPSFVGSASHGRNATNVTISVPTGVSDGDILLAVTAADRAVNNPPSGWTSRGEIDTGVTVFELWSRVAASEPASYTWSTGTGQFIDAMIAAWTDVASVELFDGPTSGTADNGFDLPSVTVSEDNSLQVVLASTWGNPNSVTAAGCTERHAGPERAWYLWAGDRGRQSGPTGFTSVDFDFGVDEFAGWQVILSPTNEAPHAPTLTNPTAGQIVESSTTERFTWDFSDPNPGDTQSKYDLQVREQGAGTATVDTSGTTPNTFHDVAGGTLADGAWEWRVRTYDAQGVVGPWTSWEPFTVATQPDPPTITDPTSGQALPTEEYTVVWSAPNQSAYQLRRVADAAGTPDTGAVYFDTGTLESTTARSLEVAFPTNGRWEHVQVRIRVDGLWSEWASVRVQVDYTVPPTPTVTVDDGAVDGAITVQALHVPPVGNEPTVTSIDVWRRQVGATDDGIRVAAGLDPAAPWTDWSPASGAAYEYRVRAHGDNGASTYSAWQA